ncbi:hypothetical protein GWI33_002748 [Rhynchophorus ferrugineus]|uniref:FLYWCH-type domain-containing protein n=1 Tax=Rhynchophorus ferrugineus TaxID=354439 RepID=A0A834IQT4_RHYFE|nr:hypothetical protein GWI33_002748 [Rhynchophorus ferrugineus]
MAANFIVNVPKLKGSENYSDWAFAIENFLVFEGLSKCISKVVEADNAKAKAKIIPTIDASLYVHDKRYEVQALTYTINGFLLLAGLPEKFSPMIMAIEHSGITISTDAIKTKLLQMEEHVGITGSAFASKYCHRLIHIIPGLKNPKIVLNCYEFVIHKKYNNKTRWRCNHFPRTKGGCKAALFTSGKVVYIYYTHNHHHDNVALEQAVPQQVSFKKVK